jgi:cell division septation protein DedD
VNTTELAPATAPDETPVDKSGAVGAPTSTLEKPSVDEAPAPVDESLPPSKIEEPPFATAKPQSAAPAAPRESDGPGFVVQVANVPKQSDANAAVKDLKTKGFDAFVSPAPKGKSGFRVRVGKYKTYDEAKAAKLRLQKMKKYHDAWVTN